jgi:hypothetical protein
VLRGMFIAGAMTIGLAVAPLASAAPTTTTTTSPAPTSGGAGVYYPNCKAACQAGAAPIYRGQPGYRAPLDRDGDGVACEVCH